MAVSKKDSPTKFVREYYSQDPETGAERLDARWHYDLERFPYGPVLTENFDANPKKVGKKVAKDD